MQLGVTPYTQLFIFYCVALGFYYLPLIFVLVQRASVDNKKTEKTYLGCCEQRLTTAFANFIFFSSAPITI